MLQIKELLNKIPEIIEASSTSFRVIALYIVMVIIVAIIFFATASDSIKLVVFMTFAVLLLPLLSWTATSSDILNRPHHQYENNIESGIGVKVYGPRDASNDDMLEDIRECTNVSFIGISQRSLATYLKQLLQGRENPLPIENIAIYFASDSDGEMWEGGSFLPSIKEARHKIAATLTNPAGSSCLKNLKSIRFYQSVHHSTFGGCFMNNHHNNQNVAYIVNYLPSSAPNTKRSLTFRVDNTNTTSHNGLHKISQSYFSAFNRIKDDAAIIGIVRPSLWDLSSTQWSEFSTSCSAHRQSMEHLITFSNLTNSDSVLDLASGTGDVSKLIKDQLTKGSLTLLDSSPQMLAKAITVLSDSASYILCNLPLKPGVISIDTQTLYNLITIHLSFPAIASSKDELMSIASWCRGHLKENGAVVASCHNTATDIPESNFDKKTDFLRAAMVDTLNNQGLSKLYRPRPSIYLTDDDIDNAFSKSGFKCTKKSTQSFEMTTDDRIAMWSAPAVLDSFIDVKEMTPGNIKKFIDVVKCKVRGKDTEPMHVKYWRYSLTS